MLDLSNCRLRTQVTEQEYHQFIKWYMKKCNIRVLKVKDMVSVRTVIDKKTKEKVSQEVIRKNEVGYLIFNNFYKEWQQEIKQ